VVLAEADGVVDAVAGKTAAVAVAFVVEAVARHFAVDEIPVAAC